MGLARYRYCIFVLIIVTVSAGFASSCSTTAKAQAKPPEDIEIWTSKDLSHDPLDATSIEQTTISALEHRTLFNFDQNSEIQPDLAEDVEISDDGSTISVDLKNETFSDGTPITSKDIKATMARIVKLNGEYAENLEEIKGFGEAKSGQDLFGVDDSKENKVVFSLISPDPYFVYHLAHPTTAILPAKSIDADGNLTSDVHSGMYSSDALSNELNAISIFKPRDTTIPTIRVVKKSSDEIAKKPYSTKADIILSDTANSIEYVQKSIPQLAVASWNLYVKDQSSPLSNQKFRQAVLVSLDGKESIDSFSARAIKPETFTVKSVDSIACGIYCDTDKEKATELIKEIYPDGNVPSITIDIEDNKIQQDLAKSASEKLNEVGIGTEIRAHNATELSNEIARGNVQLFRFGWISQVPISADPLVKSFKADSTENVSGVTNAELEKQINIYKDATNIEDKTKASKKFQKQLEELWLTRPVAQFRKVFTINKALENVYFDCYGRIDVEKITLSDNNDKKK